jgi:hypothetical protein
MYIFPSIEDGGVNAKKVPKGNSSVNRVSLKLAALSKSSGPAEQSRCPTCPCRQKARDALGATQRDIIMYLPNQYSSPCAALGGGGRQREKKKHSFWTKLWSSR